MKAFDRLVAEIEAVIQTRQPKQIGGEIAFICPSHDDRKPSARWNPEKRVWYCDVCGAGGGARDLAVALGIALRLSERRGRGDTPRGSTARTHSSSAWPPRSTNNTSGARPPEVVSGGREPLSTEVRQERVWKIPLPDGRIAEHIRKDQPGGRKKYSWRLDGEYTLGGIRSADLPLYAIDRLKDSDAQVVVTEGEKAADALLARGIAAVGTVTGAAVIPNDASLRPLLGRRVILWPDNDDKGREHMRRIADRLQALGAPVGVTR